MSNIDQIAGVQQAVGSEQKRRSAGAGQGASFQSMLEQAVAEQEQAAASTAEVTGASMAQQTAQLGQTGGVAAPDQAHVEAVGQVEDMLANLEQYAQALGQGRSLKELSGLVQNIEEQADLLAQTADNLPAGDELADLLRQTQALANAETIKFNRGDFIPA